MAKEKRPDAAPDAQPAQPAQPAEPARPAGSANAPAGPEGEAPEGPQTRAEVQARDPRIAQLEADLEQARERAVRARADYDNLSRRVTRDAAVERDRAKARVLESFIPLMELAHMAAHQAEVHPGPLSEGIVMLAREFDRLAEREGLVKVGTVGEKADPARHEVLAQETKDGVPAGHVTRVIAPGYLLGEKVLRYAKVSVAP